MGGPFSAKASSKVRRLASQAPERSDGCYDAIIIGSGMSGLTSAVILAKEGMRVLVLEQHYRPGGYMHRFFRKGGVQFDVGFHYFGGVERHQVLGAYLDYCGVLDRINLVPLDVEGYDDLRYPDFRFIIPAGEDRYRARLHETFPDEREAIDGYFSEVKKICDGFAFYRLKTEQDFGHADRWMSVSLNAYLSTITENPYLKAALIGQNPLYGVEPERTPMGLHALVTDSFMQNPYGLRGGGDHLAQVMVHRVGELGGEVKTRRRVSEILVSDERRVQGVRTERGEEYRASLIISCAHPKTTVRMLPEGCLRPGYRKRVLSLEDGRGSISVFATTKVDLSHYAKRNIYNFKSINLDTIYAAPNGADQFVFASVPTAREGRAKSGVHQVVGLGFLDWSQVAKWQHTTSGERGSEYEAYKQARGEELMALVYEVIPELRGNVESLEVATPLTNRDYAASEKGAAYGVHHCIDQSGRYGLRPRTRVGGLYLAGQSVLMPGVCGVTISAFHTCSVILGSDYLMGKVHARAGH